MTTKEIAHQLVSYLKQAKFEEAQKALFADDAISLEPKDSNIPTFQGIESLIKKGEEFRNSVETWHNLNVSEPVISKDYFAISFTVKLTYKGQNTPSNLEEIIVYHVQNGKIKQEQFFYQN